MSEPLRYIVFLWTAPSDDVENQWVSWCPNVDVVSQGNDALHALAMLREAVEMVFLSELEAHRDPRKCGVDRSGWEPVWNVTNKGKRFAHYAAIAPIEKATALVTCEDLILSTPAVWQVHSAYACFEPTATT